MMNLNGGAQENVPEDEWDNIVCLPIIEVGQTYQDDIMPERELDFLNEQQLTEEFYRIEVDLNSAKATSTESGSSVMKLVRYLLFWYRSSLDASLMAERGRILAIAGQPFDNRNKVHCQCLYTIYAKLTGDVMSGARRFGPHWEEIGFQGSDPATDFRGVGILGLFQLTFFVVSGQAGSLCREIYRLSTDSVQHYPFAITSMNMTQISLQALRDGSLNQYINQAHSALAVFNRFYFGLFLHFHTIWREQGKTIMDIGYVLQDLRKYVRGNVKKLLNSFANYVASGQNGTNSDHDDTRYDNFTNIGNIGERE